MAIQKINRSHLREKLRTSQHSRGIKTSHKSMTTEIQTMGKGHSHS